MKIISIRGATTIVENTTENICDETKKLLSSILYTNKINIEDCVNIIFSCTDDITSAYPAKFAREIGFENTPLMCLQEMKVENSLKLCIRVIMTVMVSDIFSSDIKHIYLNNAKNLRPDLVNE